MSERINPPLPSRSQCFARKLRRDSTNAELHLWQYLRSSRLACYKFRRQRPIPPYVVDFYCDAAKLVVELDGSQHNERGDAQRTRCLQALGLKVLRFWDNDVLGRTQDILANILASIDARTLTPTPLPMGEGLKTRAEP